MTSALVASAAFIYLGYRYLPPFVPVLFEPMERLAYVIRWEVLSALALFAGIALTSLGRFRDETLTDGQTESIAARYTRNTAEQLLLAVIAHTALALQLSPTSLRVVPVLVIWFLIARAIFFVGYHRSLWLRAMGFGATFYPTVGVMVLDVYLMFRR